MYILGISSYYHDSAATLIKDGKLICAIEEERFTRKKHDNQFPAKAVQFCLKFAGIKSSGLDYVSYYEKPLLKFERILETFVETYPNSLTPFFKGVPEWIGEKIKVENTIRKTLEYKGKILFVPHHLSHASAAFFPSPYQRSAILTVDGVGEYQTTGLWLGQDHKITPLGSINFPHSLGLLYSTFTSFLGFRVNEDEYKLMGLAAYGHPIYVDKISKVIDIRPDGSFKLDLNYFSFRQRYQMWNKNFEVLFGKPRKNKERINKFHKDLAASIQKITEEVYFKMLNHLQKLTESESVCIAGGVGLNALANGKIYESTRFKKVFIFGAAGDSGAAVGSALFTYHSILKNKNRFQISNLYTGSKYEDDEMKQVLKTYKKLKYKKYESTDELINKTAKLLAKNKIVGWFQGRCEFGPRALGNRSILAKPNPHQMKTRVNVVKRREQFRPFAGSILQEKVQEYFEVPEKNHWSPFMVFCFNVKEQKREELAAIVHADNSCRIQTVNKDNGLYYSLVKEFYALTGTPCLMNTSFNLKGEPIVETPQHAINDFLKTNLDFLVLGNYLIAKK